jgi:hypothetical protein
MSALDTLFSARPWRTFIITAAAACITAACGGGGGVDTGGTGGTPTTFSSGRISGFGSIIVNGVRFDDTAATVIDDDGTGHSRAELELGMVVDVTAGAVVTDANGAQIGTATQITFGSDLKGPVQAINPAAGTATVLGQMVKVDANTVFADLATGLASLQVGDTVEVFAFFDAATGTYTATRIETQTGLSSFKVRGPIANLDTGAKTFSIGNLTVSYAGVANMPALSNGTVVRVKLHTVPQAGTWTATRLDAGMRQAPDLAETELEGFVTDFTGLSSFKVNGMPVDASASTVTFEDGTAQQMANGVRVEVEGVTSGGVLIARKVEFKPASDDGIDGHGGLEIELHGTIEAAPVGTGSFVLRGLTVHYDGNTRFDGGTAASVAVGARVEVKGNVISGSSDLLATRVKFED